MNKKEYLDLISEIARHDALYYDECNPEITDFAYDELVKKAKEIEQIHPEWKPSDSPLEKIGESPSPGFKTVKHRYPMLSLANTYSEEELDDFTKRMQKLLEREHVDFFAELKMDGVAISVRYEKGKFVQALTRGNGKEGDDVTINISQLANLPLQLKEPKTVELRGEVYLPIEIFQELNKEKEENGQEVWANPRNAAAGSIKLLDKSEVKRRKLHIVFYDIVEIEDEEIKRQSSISSILTRIGLPTFDQQDTARCKNPKEVLEFAEKIEKKRPFYPFQIDGIVIKLDTLEERGFLGTTGKTPRWAVAYKFAPEQAITTINDITVQVGRTGILTPVAELEPTLLAGSTISRATLHNQDEIDRKDIRIHDTVWIEKGGDVIPKVAGVDFTKRDSHSKAWKMPSFCPSCQSPVVRLESEVAFRCLNSYLCPAQSLRRITFFVAKGAMDIDHLGEKIVEKLLGAKIISSISDIYKITSSDLEKLEGFKEKSIHNLLDSIERSKNVPLARFIFALGIKYVGAGGSEILANHFKNIENIKKATKEELLELEGIGPKMAESIVEFFSKSRHVQEIEELLSLGVEPKAPEEIKSGHPFFQKIFVLTGTLEKYPRAEAAALIKQRGGKVASSVSKETDYLLAGSEAGSKLKKAESLGIKVLSEEEFDSML